MLMGTSRLPVRLSIQAESDQAKLVESTMESVSGGQAVHYSADFAAVGYGGASHGCVNVRDRDAVARLFDQVRVGDAVIVYWS